MPKYFKGLPHKRFKKDRDLLLTIHGGIDEHITFADLLVNSNYLYFGKNLLPFFESYKDIYLVANYRAKPIDILGNNKVEGVKTVQTELGEPDQNGRRVPIPISGSERIYDADVVIVAFGFRASPANWFEDFNINTRKDGLVIAEENQEYKFQTSNKKIFSGGDMVRGSDLVVTAIWEGREAGKSIIKYVS